ncbi:MAG: hypothetical protein AAGG08_03555 [Actinomycetota bacterium]
MTSTTHLRSRRGTRLATLCAAGTLLLAACGGSDAGSDSDGIASLGEATSSQSDSTGSGSGSEAGDTASSDTVGSDTASSDTGTGIDSDELEAPEDIERAYELYEQCLEDLGIDLGLDVGLDGAAVEGEQESGVAIAAGEIDDADFEEMQRCEGHLANADAGFDLSPEQQAELADAELAFARCMRDAGFDWPDPSGAGSGEVIEIDASDDIDAITEATQECSSVYDGIGLGEEG